MNTDRLAFEEAATTVMGPAATAQLQEVVLQELAFQMGRTTDQLSETEKRGAEAISQRVQSTIVAPYVSNITEKANTLCDESRRELLLAANEHTDDSRNLSDIRNKFRKLQDYMIEQHTIYKRAKDEIASLEKQVEELMYDEDGSYIYKDEEDDKKVDNLNKTIKLQQSKAKNAMKKLHTLIDNPMEVGTEEGDNGTIVKEDNSGRGQLKFNKHLDKSSTIEIHKRSGNTSRPTVPNCGPSCLGAITSCTLLTKGMVPTKSHHQLKMDIYRLKRRSEASTKDILANSTVKSRMRLERLECSRSLAHTVWDFTLT